MSYASEVLDSIRQAGALRRPYYLTAEKPADLPIQMETVIPLILRRFCDNPYGRFDLDVTT